MFKNDNDFLNKALIAPLDSKEKETHLEARKTEIKSYVFVTLANIGFGLLNFHCKLTKQIFVESFDPVCFVIYRSMAIALLGYYLCHTNNTEITQWSEIKKKFWFFGRTVGNYLSFFTFVMMMMYFRASTAACINSMFPAVSIFFSIMILNEKFYVRYIVGLFVCIAGTLMIIFNERSDPNKKPAASVHVEEVNNADFLRILYGSIFGIANIFAVAFLTISIKIVINEKINFHVQCFWVGVTNTICGIIQVLFMGSVNLYFPYFFFSFCNGGLWYYSNHLLMQGYKNIDISKTAPLAYLATVTMFVLGVVCLAEPIFFTDLIGSMMILSFNLYNVYVPPKK